MHPRPSSRRHFLATFGLSLLSPAALGLRGQSPPAGGATAAGDNVERVYRESFAALPNPERGFYAQRRSDRLERLGSLRDDGITLLLVTFDLRDFKERELTSEKLQELGGALNRARDGGFKVILRAAYGFTGRDYRADPTDLGRIVRHIRQIGAVVTEHRDVVCGIQAGMLGPWGEWHGSNHGDPPSLEARRAVLFGWLEAVPSPITVHVRRPMFIRDLFAPEPGGFNLTPATAFTGSPLSRVGWHNDAFLARPSDLGTYAERGWDRERELTWCSQHGRFTPFGGEAVHSETPMPVPEMIREMERLHATYLNIGHHPKVVQLWRETVFRGENTLEHIARRLGYRFVAQRLTCPRALRRGESLSFTLALANVGFASPHLPRVVTVALLPADRDVPLHARDLAEADPRRWGPETGTIALRGMVAAPARAPLGPLRLAVRLADASERLRDDSRYAIRFANEDIAFTASGGWNILADDIVVTP